MQKPRLSPRLQFTHYLYTLPYLGCIVCAIITCRLKSSTIFSCKRTAVGFLAMVMVSILSCSLSNA